MVANAMPRKRQGRVTAVALASVRSRPEVGRLRTTNSPKLAKAAKNNSRPVKPSASNTEGKA